MKKSVSIERLPGGYSVRYWEASHRKRKWFQDYKLAQKFEADKKLALLAKAQGQIDPTLKPIDLFRKYLQSLSSNPDYREATVQLKYDALYNYMIGLASTERLGPKYLQVYMMEKQYNINGMALRLRELKAFNNWCVREGYLENDLFTIERQDGKKEKFLIPKGTEVGRKLEIEEAKKLLLNSSPKFQLFIAFLLGHGSRFGETYKTKREDLNLAQAVWHIPPKNNKAKKDKYIPLAPFVMKKLLETTLPDTGRIFPKNNIYRMFNAAKKKAGIQGKLRIHDMRHTFASHWKGDIRDLMANMGWSSVEMLKKYSHPTVEDIRKEAETKGIAQNFD